MARRPLLVGTVLFLGFLFVFFTVSFLTARFGLDGVFGTGEGKIGLIRIEGMILDSTETLNQLRNYSKNPSIKAILVRINSPGGAVAPSQEIYQEIKNIREQGKTVVSSMGSLAASGGYYIAAATDRIVANPGTLTGSIGVIMELANVEGLLQKVGVESVVIKSGEHKDMASPFRKMTPEERALLQSVLDDVHDQFIEAVAEGRSLTTSDVRALADGRIFTGRQAKENGLIDELGGLQDAIRITGELIGMTGEPTVVEPSRRFSILDLLQAKFWGTIAAAPLSGKTVRINYLLSF